MKILYSLPHPSHRLDTSGAGHTVRARALIDALRRSGAEVVVDQAAAAGNGSAAQTYRRFIKRLVPKSIALRLRDRGRVVFGQRYGVRLTRAASEQKPEVLLQTHIAFSLSGKIASEATGVPLVLDDVAPSWEEQQHYGVGNRKLAAVTHHEVTRLACLCVAVNGPMRRFLEEDGIPSSKLIEIPNGVDAKIFAPGGNGTDVRHQFDIEDDEVVVVFVGSFQPFHRVDLLIDSFNKLKSKHRTRLLMVGSGRELETARNLVKTSGNTAGVIFTGTVDYTKVPHYIAAGDIAVIPATADYCNPMKVYEYMAMGKAVVAPDQETITEIGTSGRDIQTFQPENVASLTAVLDQLIADEELRTELGRAAARTIAREHTWQKRAEQLLQAIEEKLR